MNTEEDIRLRRRTVGRVGKRPVPIYEDVAVDLDSWAEFDDFDVDLKRFSSQFTPANAQVAQNWPPRTSSLPPGGARPLNPESTENPGDELSLPQRARPAISRAEPSPVVAGPSTQRQQSGLAAQEGAAPKTLLRDIEQHHAKIKQQIVEIIKRSNELDKLMTRPHVKKTLAARALSVEGQVFETPALLRQQTEDIQEVWGIYDALGEIFGEAARETDALKDSIDSM